MHQGYRKSASSSVFLLKLFAEMPHYAQVCREMLAEGKSVVVDNTSPDPKARGDFLAVAKAAGVPARCFVFETSRVAFHSGL